MGIQQDGCSASARTGPIMEPVTVGMAPFSTDTDYPGHWPRLRRYRSRFTFGRHVCVSKDQLEVGRAAMVFQSRRYELV
jgi:hypothetical protein